MPCPHDNMASYKFVLTPDLIHYGKWICGDCGGFLGWEAKPETKERNKANESKRLSLKTVTLEGWDKEFVESLKPWQRYSPRQQKQLDRIAAENQCE